MTFARAPNGMTFLEDQYSSYPFHICRPFYLDDGETEGMATVYTQSCSGGLYARDQLTMDITAKQDAQVHLTTQASSIVHEGAQGVTEQICRITAENGALVEYLPDPVILFPGARLRSEVRLAVAPRTTAIVFDSFLTHDYRDENGIFDFFDNSVSIFSEDGVPLAIDRFKVTGRGLQRGRIGEMGQFLCHGNIMVVAPNTGLEPMLNDARRVADDATECMVGLSELPSSIGFSARVLASDASALKKSMNRLWAMSRQHIAGQFPEPRRK